MNIPELILAQYDAGGSGGDKFALILVISAIVVALGMLIFFFSRYQKCPSDRILVIYGKTSGGQSSKCLHGGASFVWPVIQAFEYLDLTPIPIDIPLEGALSKQNIRVNTPSTFTVGISTDPSVMSNAAERLLGLQLSQVRDLARDMIFGSMRYVISTMDIEAIKDRDQFIEQIVDGVEGELRRVGLRLINVNIKDITDESGYLESLGKEALLNVNNRINMDVTQEIAALKEELKELKLAIQEIRTNSQGV